MGHLLAWRMAASAKGKRMVVLSVALIPFKREGKTGHDYEWVGNNHFCIFSARVGKKKGSENDTDFPES